MNSFTQEITNLQEIARYGRAVQGCDYDEIDIFEALARPKIGTMVGKLEIVDVLDRDLNAYPNGDSYNPPLSAWEDIKPVTIIFRYGANFYRVDYDSWNYLQIIGQVTKQTKVMEVWE